MAVRTFSIGELSKVDGGRIAETFDELVRKAIADCEDRPANKKARTVSLVLSLVPRVRDCYEVEFGFDVKSAVPTTHSPAYFGSIRKGADGAGFVFDDLTNDVGQLGLDRDSSAFDE